MDRLSSIVGPIVPSALATLDGWTWKSELKQDRTVLNRGEGPIDVFPPVRAETTKEKGWLNSLTIFFSDPYSEMLFSCDNWTFRSSPFLTLFSGLPVNNDMIYCSVYNPATPIGPLYSIAWTPSQFWPYRTQLLIQAQHPATAPTATSQIVAASLGRHFIRDDKQFYESIFIEGQRQSLGRVQVPIRRNV